MERVSQEPSIVRVFFSPADFALLFSMFAFALTDSVRRPGLDLRGLPGDSCGSQGTIRQNDGYFPSVQDIFFRTCIEVGTFHMISHVPLVVGSSRGSHAPRPICLCLALPLLCSDEGVRGGAVEGG